ncbi:DUF4625 domain-containing protein [Nafulsella turpanensis]|uniref:DUF4625 domain-containing protein n=1 Tax=Nafulsella turpanensis TaxID=1265690 RepID=UPI00034C35AC|nr:DUF4625 domain-containing protein [Nafulsella turpanensis]
MNKFSLLTFAVLACLFMACEDEAVPDTTAPLVAITSPSDGATYGQEDDVVVKAAVTDESELEAVSLIITPPAGEAMVLNENKDNFTNNNREVLIDRILSLSLLGTLAPGEYLLTVQATDVFDNVTDESITINIREAEEADAEAPAITINTPGEGATFGPAEEIALNASLADNIAIKTVNIYVTAPGAEAQQVYTEELAEQPAETVIEEQIVMDSEAAAGEYTITVEAIDPAGNKATETTKIELREADGSAPTLRILNPGEGREFDTDDVMSVEINASDNVELAGALVQLALPGGQVEELFTKSYTDRRTNTEIRLTHAFSAESPLGEYTLTAKVTDSGGNTTEKSVNILLKASDALAPSITLHSPAAGTVFTPGETVEANAAVTDEEGLTSASLTLSFPDGQTQEIYAEEFTDSRTETDITEQIVLASDAPEGTYTLTAMATDLQGHSRDKSIEFEVRKPDTTVPSVTISSPTANAEFYLNQDIALEALAEDEASLEEVTVWLQGAAGEPQLVHTENPQDFLNNAKEADLTESISVDGFAAGNYTLIVRATDTAGNSTEGSVQIILLEADTEAPAIALYSPEPGSSHARGSEVYVDALVTDNQHLAEVHVEVTVWIAGSQQSLYEETITEFEDPTRQAIQETKAIPSDAPTGTYYVTITATDAAGNTTENESTFEVTNP